MITNVIPLGKLICLCLGETMKPTVVVTILLLCLLSGCRQNSQSSDSTVRPAQKAKTHSIDELIEGVSNYASSIDGAGFEVEFDHNDTYYKPDGKQYWYKELHVSQLVAARKFKIEYREYFPMKPEGKQYSGSRIVFKDGVTTEQMLDAVTIEAGFSVRLLGYNRFSDYLFLNIFRDVKWGDNDRLEQSGGVEPEDMADEFGLPQRLLKYQEKYKLNGTEVVDGVECVVLEWEDNDRICIDVKHGFIPKKRQLFMNGELISEHIQMDLRLVGDTWIPWRQEVTNFYSTEDAPDAVGKIYTFSVNVIKRIEIRKSAESEFDFQFRPDEKVLVRDRINGKQYLRDPNIDSNQ